LKKKVPKKILVTGANGNLGMRLVRELAQQCTVVAAVRSASARDAVRNAMGNTDNVIVEVVDYNDAETLVGVAQDCTDAVHLVGIIKKTAANPYHLAHEGPCAALVSAVERSGIRNIVYLSLVGSDTRSANACFASRARAEDLLLESGTPVTIIRVPMVLGEGDYASASLTSKATSAACLVFRGASLEQPIYAGDVISAIVGRLGSLNTETLELAGPESLSRRELIARAAASVGRSTMVISLPIFVGLAIASLLELVTANPPVTRDMLDILDHDDDVEAQSAADQLGIHLTPLAEMLSLVIRPL
jgi:uncharacterized protein YbjT (DUF2867 family)